MRTSSNHSLRRHSKSHNASWRKRGASFERLEPRNLMDAAGFVETNLASDIPNFAAHTDRDLINPWGATETPQGQFRVAANGAGNAPLMTAQGQEEGPAIFIPAPPSDPKGTVSAPNGVVSNTTHDFVITEGGHSAPASLIFSTEDGTIAAFNPDLNKTQAVLAADQSSTGAVYKLVTMASNTRGNFLYATDFHNNKIDVFDKNFHKVTLGSGGFGTFTDPKEPAGYAPFGVKSANGILFVTYAKQLGPDNHDDQEGPGNGLIDEFDTSGHFIKRFATGSAVGGTAPLNSPIGAALAPPGFGPNGKFGGALLIGNFGDSRVSAFDPATGKFLGQLTDAQGHTLVLNGGFKETNTKGLWGIAFGNGQGGAATDALFFAAGINGEADGLFGKVTMATGDAPDEDNLQPPSTHSDDGDRKDAADGHDNQNQHSHVASVSPQTAQGKMAGRLADLVFEAMGH